MHTQRWETRIDNFSELLYCTQCPFLKLWVVQNNYQTYRDFLLLTTGTAPMTSSQKVSLIKRYFPHKTVLSGVWWGAHIMDALVVKPAIRPASWRQSQQLWKCCIIREWESWAMGFWSLFRYMVLHLWKGFLNKGFNIWSSSHALESTIILCGPGIRIESFVLQWYTT